MKTKKNKKAGFTLVELMVVAIIVAILAAVAIPLMSGNKNRAMATEGQAGCSTISTQLRVYRAEHGNYTAAGTDPLGLPGLNTGDLDGKYFDDDSYGMTTGADTFTITATGIAGTTDDPADAAGIIVTLNQDGAWGDTGTVSWQ